MKCYLDAIGNKINKKEYGAYGITFFDDKGQKINEYFSEDNNTTYIKENFKGILFLMKKYGTKNFKNIITVYCDSGVTVQTFTNWIHKWHKFNWTKVDGTPPQNLEILKEYYELWQQGYRINIKRLKGYHNRQANLQTLALIERSKKDEQKTI